MSIALNKTRAIFVDRTELANQKSTNTTCVSGAATARYSSSPKLNQLEGLGPELTVTEPKVGRNQPCPCGSGKKYKHCCGKIE
jgi:preprotein translocase subunit SecA